MRKSIILMAIILSVSCFASMTSAGDLTGQWSGNDGSTYYIRQSGNHIDWYGEDQPTETRWSNIAVGNTDERHIWLNYADVPKGSDLSAGSLTLRIQNPDRLVLVASSNPYYGTHIWTRQ